MLRVASRSVFSVSRRALSSEVQDVPVRLFGVGGRYATALYFAGQKSKAGVAGIEDDLKNLQDMMSKNAQFKEFIMDPTVPRVQKVSGIRDILGKTGFQEETSNVLSLIAENGRMSQLPKIIDSFSTIMQAHRKEVLAEVTSAQPLKKQQIDQVKSALGRFVKQGETIVLSTKVDADIIGGLVVTIGDRFIDLSINTRINEISRLLDTSAL